MHSEFRKLRLILMGILAVFVLTAAGLSEPARGVLPTSSLQEESCLPILLEAAQRAGIPGVIVEQSGNEGSLRKDDIFCFVRVENERDGGVYYTELSIKAYLADGDACYYNSNISFHGYDAYSDMYSDENRWVMLELYTYGAWFIRWMVESDGYCHEFYVNNGSEYPGWSEDVAMGAGTDFQMPDVDPVKYAEILWSVAEGYLPFFEQINSGDNLTPPSIENDDNQSPPIIENEDSQSGPIFVDGDSTPTEDHKVPVLVILGSVSVPLVGAITGTILSTILSGGGVVTSGVAKKPRFGSVNEAGLVWSPRPWDQAGPGYVPKEEHLRTKDFLEKGYQWTSQGWKTREEIRDNELLQMKNDAAVEKADSAWRKQWEKEHHELEQKKAELVEKGKQIDFAGNMMDLQADLDSIHDQLKQENIYVANPYQGDPTLIVYGTNIIKNMVWDNTAGILTGDHGLTCQGFVEKTQGKVLEKVAERFPGAKVQNMIFEEKSSRKPKKSVLEWFDSLVDDNHNLIKITLPDGSEWAVDFHQYEAGNAPLMRPWSEAQKDWGEKYMGSEFYERTRRTTIATPKSGN